VTFQTFLPRLLQLRACVIVCSAAAHRADPGFGKFRSQNCHGMIFMIISITTIGHKLASLWGLS